MICPFCFALGDDHFEKECQGHHDVLVRFCDHCGELLEHCVKCITEDKIDAYLDGVL